MCVMLPIFVFWRFFLGKRKIFHFFCNEITGDGV